MRQKEEAREKIVVLRLIISHFTDTPPGYYTANYHSSHHYIEKAGANKTSPFNWKFYDLPRCLSAYQPPSYLTDQLEFHVVRSEHCRKLKKTIFSLSSSQYSWFLILKTKKRPCHRSQANCFFLFIDFLIFLFMFRLKVFIGL